MEAVEVQENQDPPEADTNAGIAEPPESEGGPGLPPPAPEAVEQEGAEQDEAPPPEPPAPPLPPTADEANIVAPDEVKEAERLDQEERQELQQLQLNGLEGLTGKVEPPCLVLVVCSLPLPEVLALRAVSSSCLQWSMHGAIARLGEVCHAHHRIRTRLWIQRLEEINSNTNDETVYDSKVRRLADDALRRRMEAEMADARQDMENRIRDFHLEVDRRMEAQAVRVHAIVEERVQQQLDAILAAEMEKVRVLVEERVQGRVRQVVQREVYATVCEMQAKLATLAKENEKLRTVFLEHLDHSDLCFRSLVWALNPNSTGLFARTLRLIWCCRRRFTRFSAWMLGVPLERRRDILRARLELMHQAGALRSAGQGNEGQRIEGRQKLLAALQGAAEVAEAQRQASEQDPEPEDTEATEILEDARDASNPEGTEQAPEDEDVEVPEVSEGAQDARDMEVQEPEQSSPATAPAVATRDLQRTAEELVAAALGACRSPAEAQEPPPQPRRASTSTNQESGSEGHLTEVPSDEEEMANLLAAVEEVVEAEAAREDEPEEAAVEVDELFQDAEDAEVDEVFWDAVDHEPPAVEGPKE